MKCLSAETVTSSTIRRNLPGGGRWINAICLQKSCFLIGIKKNIKKIIGCVFQLYYFKMIANKCKKNSHEARIIFSIVVI